ncbi:hypothetical protein BN1723_006779 [Verticillium longisporum]|uniref:Uncharacterized protein n=1 Tax=Verticillium longisporum TaxID=100787 RepID=A0A0G4NHA8_VERLO|nr:hypothetical protein BN1723_006779 [Verticillium longisporum]
MAHGFKVSLRLQPWRQVIALYFQSPQKISKNIGVNPRKTLHLAANKTNGRHPPLFYLSNDLDVVIWYLHIVSILA